ncbi:MAG: pirin family protein [Deltaproteobacteria bacterium]|nr:MAG: pirin family protein [Deltaproteobacteria bacterium]
MQWPTVDPFLLCVHHVDDYPAGNEELGPRASLVGRRIGEDFEGLEGWRMYHGTVVPGFPAHPHRGFETLTLVRRGFVDHADSLGAAARYGAGDVQWLTAGRGLEHSEIFPLLDREGPNPLDLFQIWLNLPAKEKGCEPRFTMYWAERIPRPVLRDEAGRRTELTLVAGAFGDLRPPPPPPASWAARPEAEVAVWTIRLEPSARFRLPAASPGVHRSLYFFEGSTLSLDGEPVTVGQRLEVLPDRPLQIESGPDGAELLLLQGRPIGEPVAHYGPFVMNTREELLRAFAEYQEGAFGRWPWGRRDPVHGPAPERFATHPDGHTERPG